MGQNFFIRAAVKPFVHGVQEIIGSTDIELPDIFSLPRGKSFWIYGFNISIGEQAKHFQAFWRAHFFRKLLDSVRVENVTSQRSAQFQMVRNQEQNIIAIGEIEFEAVESLLRNRSAGDRVAFPARGFTCVVQQQSEIQQVGLLKFIEKLR